jgi:Flp pilus assembly protein TadG
MRGIASLLKRHLVAVRRPGRSLLRDEKGAVAIEFAILALPFFTIVFAILETSIVFLAGQVLDSAVQDATRKVRTGEAQTYNLAQFRTEVCNGLFNMFDCSKLKISVKTISTFSQVSSNFITPIKPSCDPSTDPNQCWQVTEAYAAGTGSSIELVQVFYKWPTIIDFGGFNLQNQSDNGGARLLSAVRVFRNEPYS